MSVGRRRSALPAVAAVAVLALAGCGPNPSAGQEPTALDSAGEQTVTPGSTAAAPSPTPSAERSAAPTAAPPSANAATAKPRRKRRSDAPGQRAVPSELATLELPDLPKAVDRGPILGADMSWPQCPKGMGIAQKRSHGSPMPVAEAEYVVLGLTNGPAFYPNPCLAGQVDWVERRGLMAAAYSVLSFPEERHLRQLRDHGPYDGSTRLGALRNVGYQQALFNVQTMERSGLRSPVVWLDVEPVPDFPWSGDMAANAAVVEGAARGYRDLGLSIGLYSTRYMWTGIVGDFRLGVPEWRPAGETSRDAALAQCHESRSIQGGEPILAQWVEADRDMNVTCPGPIHLGLWFHQY